MKKKKADFDKLEELSGEEDDDEDVFEEEDDDSEEYEEEPIKKRVFTKPTVKQKVRVPTKKLSPVEQRVQYYEEPIPPMPEPPQNDDQDLTLIIDDLYEKNDLLDKTLGELTVRVLMMEEKLSLINDKASMAYDYAKTK